MRKKMFIVVLFLIGIVYLLNRGTFVSARVLEPLSSLGDYVVRLPVNSTIKVYLEPKLKEFAESNGITVYKEEKKFWFITVSTKYYYYANKYVSRIVESREIFNDVDSLIFMVSELEKEAIKYDKDDYKNLVLGYIRTINASYDSDGYFGYWKLLAGETPTDFINMVNADTSHGLRFNEYFSQFLEYCNYNKAVHGDLEEKYKSREKLDLIDSYYGNKKIDLIHMFASIDGIYSKTGTQERLGKRNMERDILSWNGDLQQVCRYIRDYNETLRAPDEMQYIFGKSNMGATEDDILADIDAMNITKTYIDFDDNSISNSLSAYYSLLRMHYKNRYRMFVNTVVLDNELQKSNNELEDFENEIYCQFNIKKKNGIIEEYEYYNPSICVIFGIMRCDTDFPANIFGDLPSYEIRKYVTTCFINYIEVNL